MANRYSRLDNQSPAQSALEANNVNVGRSAHDCSHVVSGNTMFGLLTPVLTMEVVPNEDIDLSAVALLEFRNPTTRQLLNGARVFFHAYYNRLDDLWEGAKNWLDEGRSGKINLTRPNLIYHHSFSDSGTSVEVDSCTPMSLLNFIGLPVSHIQENLNDEGVKQIPLRQFQCSINYSETEDGVTTKYATSTKVGNYTDYFPADVAFAYQRNWRDFYSNKNLLQNNDFWFPDNEDHFILSYSCENAVCIDYENENLSDEDEDIVSNLLGYNYGDVSAALNANTPEPNNPSTNEDSYISINAPNLSAIKFRQFRGDCFTTASPFADLIRGDIPILQLTEDNFIRMVGRDNSYSVAFDGALNADGVPLYVSTDSSIGSASISPLQDLSLYGKLCSPESSVTMSDIYTLETLTAFKRRMGMTNGDYNEMIKAQYGVSPNVHDRKGTYIGGFYQDFAFSSVTQTSQTDSTPLGTKAGQGVSSGNGSFGHFHTPDFGWISVYMSISYDSMYTQGKSRQFSKKSALEMYFPIFNNLPAQEIRNDELFISGNAITDSSPFGYEDRFAEYKSMPNRVTGFMSLSPSYASFDSARIMARRFGETPSLNHMFVTMVPENQDMSVFTVYDEPPFDYSIGFSIRRVFPGPYTAIEGGLSSPNLNLV